MAKKNLTNIIIVAVAIFLGAGYFFSIKAQKVDVYKYTTNLKAGSKINPEMLQPIEIDKKLAVDGGYVTNLEQVQGKTVITDVYKDTPVMSQVLSNEENSIIDMKLEKGKIAYTIPISSVTGVSAKLRQGNIVNVYTSIDDSNIKISRQLLANVKVLDVVKTNVTEENPSGELAGAVLEINPNEVTKLAFAKDYGKISLGMVKTEDTSSLEKEVIDINKVSK